ncbi:MAG: hypothetical protein M1836_005366 [Candelina mexicana]|nr:MAG: hypothetical protein M1836_005366 [Candelina mexicana]
MEARKSDNDPVVPKVFLHATHERALELLKMDDLKRFASEGEAANSSTTAQTPGSTSGSAIKEV